MATKTEVVNSSLREFTPNKLKEYILNKIKAKPEMIKKIKPMLWGAPGIGKSCIVYELAQDLGKLMGRKPVVRDIRLLMFNPVDLRGIPVADATRTKSIWLKPTMFDFDPSDSVINILFFDELSNAPHSVQSAALQIIQDRAIGEHKLPDNVMIIAAGNRATDRAGSTQMTKSLANRFQHFAVASSLKDWKQWAIPAGIDQRIIGFLSFRENMLFSFDPSSDDNAFPTPRSWEMASDYLSCITDDSEIVDAVAPCIGIGAATEFNGYLKVYGHLPSMQDIVDGKKVDVPNQPDVMFALSSALVSCMSKQKLSPIQKENVMKFVTSMSVDFSLLTFKDMILIPGFLATMSKSATFVQWSSKHSDVFANR